MTAILCIEGELFEEYSKTIHDKLELDELNQQAKEATDGNVFWVIKA